MVKSLFIGLAMLFLAGSTQAQFSFVTNVDNTITITGYNTAAGLNAVIPASTNGYPVVNIGDNVFNGSSITNVIIPNGITNISVSAFFDCENLFAVIIPNSVTSIGNSAFSFCFSLQRVDIPDSVTSIGVNAFSSCSIMRYVGIGNGVTNIGYEAFYNCNSLTNFNVSASNPAYCSVNGVLFDVGSFTP